MNERTLTELLALAVLYSEGKDPAGLEAFLNHKDQAVTAMLTTRFENNPAILKREVAKILSGLREEVKTASDVKEITPQEASAIDGEQVKELKVASITNLAKVSEGRKNDNPDNMPKNYNDEVLSFLEKGSSVDGAFGKCAGSDELAGLYQ